MHFGRKSDIVKKLMKTSKTNDDAWLSLVERYVRDVEVAGSNPVASIPWQGHWKSEKERVSGLFLCLKNMRP